MNAAKSKFKYEIGTKVWCRPRLVDNPILGVYVGCVSESEIKQGFRPGEIVLIKEKEYWIRTDLCNINYDTIAAIKS